MRIFAGEIVQVPMLGPNKGHLQISVVSAGDSSGHHHVDFNSFLVHVANARLDIEIAAAVARKFFPHEALKRALSLFWCGGLAEHAHRLFVPAFVSGAKAKVLAVRRFVAFSRHADAHGDLAPLRRLLAPGGIEIVNDGFYRRAEMGVAIKNFDAVAHVSFPFYFVLSLGKPKASTAMAIHLSEL